MSASLFKTLVTGVMLIFCLLFAAIVVPAFIAAPNIIDAFAAGFVNPFSSGYSLDVILCWVILAIWVIYEQQQHGIKQGWICLLLGIIPGVAVGFGLYLLLRRKQLKTHG